MNRSNEYIPSVYREVGLNAQAIFSQPKKKRIKRIKRLKNDGKKS